MAHVAGPPRRYENKERSSPWSDAGFAWCSQRARTHTSVTQEPHRHPKQLCLRARTSDSLGEEAPPGGGLIFTSVPSIVSGAKEPPRVRIGVATTIRNPTE